MNRQSNHPPAVIKTLPENINNRISGRSCSEKVFDEAKPIYQKALQDAGYKYQMKFKKIEIKVKEKKNKKRDVTWFNPPWSHAVKEPVGALFLRAIDRHFPKTHPLSKLFNSNTLKISYCTTKNLKSIVAAHYPKILNPT